MEPKTKLRLIKVVHSVVWAFFAGCILAIPVSTYQGHRRASAALIGLVLIEVVILAFNRMRCPLTDVAARYTPERQDNFDIYLPVWLARWNKQIFGGLFVAGLVYTLAVWLRGM
jgi:uncharacterized membrane protein